VRHLILSDIHGNWDAMDSVLHDVLCETFDSIVVLGDLVGYGAAPVQVIDGVRRFGDKLSIVRGNHDKVVAGIDEGLGFNPMALRSAQWTREQLEVADRAYLAELPPGPREVDGFLICHGSPIDEDQYMLSERIAAESFEAFAFKICFFGPTHRPGVFSSARGVVEHQPLLGEEGRLSLLPEVRYLVNPGSVGQPRDRDPRAAYMIYDSDERLLSWFRTEYPIERAQSRIREAELPTMHAERLAHGV